MSLANLHTPALQLIQVMRQEAEQRLIKANHDPAQAEVPLNLWRQRLCQQLRCGWGLVNNLQQSLVQAQLVSIDARKFFITALPTPQEQ